ncbi:MAG: protein translocase subunit SecF [Sphingomonadales bacterium CG12_big_fil_rev_8_21_14_0_65_65_10]|uniref:protein translocase subunit SecF n=1 Tax=Blastomonas marina TaxID=1867408 RepID=UPI000CC03778|nr:protein translocase subunit SecF [Blastomonas marina]PIW55600.1 MAG: protein translocase subunit SecF [Sphingomonadales bacterium CG12_big_fil_rev_8_21_14_0_65_65_10]WPZ05119.1 protein translocase subunit SecF [Blastomonas marina]
MKLLKLVPDDTNIKFLKYRIPFYVVSVLLIVASWALVATNGLNYGVDFAGGQEVRATFTESAEAPVAEVRETVGSLGYGSPVVQRFGEPNQVSIRVRLPDEVAEDKEAAQRIANEVVGSLESEFSDFRLDGNDNVSGKVSGEFFTQAQLALLVAMLAIALYIWIRFEWQFGVGALFALFHDVSLTLGMFAIFQMEFNLTTIAAILAIIGYSLNDTIVVYDRIRENLKKYRKMPIPELLDLSVNETLARTVMTSLTLLVALLPLLLFGPEALFGLTAAIFLGIFVGTYSSVYMAAPILIWLGVDSHSFVPEETELDRQEKAARDLG